MSVTPIVCDPDAWVSACCKSERCALCGQPASAKLVEQIFHDDPFHVRHALSAYVCATHFIQIMGSAGVTWVEEYRAKLCPYIDPETTD